MKLRVTSGNVRESLTHWPGRGSGTSLLFTGNQLAFIEACSYIWRRWDRRERKAFNEWMNEWTNKTVAKTRFWNDGRVSLVSLLVFSFCVPWRLLQTNPSRLAVERRRRPSRKWSFQGWWRHRRSIVQSGARKCLPLRHSSILHGEKEREREKKMGRMRKGTLKWEKKKLENEAKRKLNASCVSSWWSAPIIRLSAAINRPHSHSLILMLIAKAS